MLHVVRIETDAAFGAIVAQGLELLGHDPVVWTDHESGRTRIELYYDTAQAAAATARQLDDSLRSWTDGEAWMLRTDVMPDALVVANLLASLLLEAVERIDARVLSAEGSMLVLSGILASEYETVCAAYLPRGYALDTLMAEGEWATLCLRRVAAT